MKKWMLAAGSFFILSLVSAGCARVEKVVAVEGDRDIPYESIGTLEVKERIPVVSPSGMAYSTAEALTLGMANTPSRAERYKKDLRDKLASKAKKEYGADSVVKVVYWPDPASGSFPEGYLYARGEMIRYRKFPIAEPQPAQPETSSAIAAS